MAKRATFFSKKHFLSTHYSVTTEECPNKSSAFRQIDELKFLFYFNHTSAIAYGIKIIILLTYATADMWLK